MVGWPRCLNIMGTVCETAKQAIHRATVATAIARPRVRVGKISASTTQTTGPMATANEAT